MHARRPSPLLAALCCAPLWAAACGRDEAPPLPVEAEVVEEEAAVAVIEPPAPEVGGVPARPPEPAPSPRAKAPAKDKPEWAHPYASDDPEDDVRQLKEMLAREDLPPEIRALMAELLGGYTRPDSVDTLLEVTESDDPKLVVGAVRGLRANSGKDPRAVAALRDLQSHPNAEVRGAAEEALKDLE